MRYNDRITLQSQTVESFKGGTSTVTWNTINTYWSNVSEAGKEEYINIKGQQKSLLKIIIREATKELVGLDKSIHRFVFDNRIVHIESGNDRASRKRNFTIIGRIEENA